MFTVGFFVGFYGAVLSIAFIYWATGDVLRLLVGAPEAAIWRRRFWVSVARVAIRKAERVEIPPEGDIPEKEEERQLLN